MPYFNIVAETSENTVVTEYEPVKKRSDSYQSEAATGTGVYSSASVNRDMNICLFTRRKT